jgi:hypothetical protein
MRKMLTIIGIALLLAGASWMIVRYLFLKQEFPNHALYIPKDAFAIATINLKALALDSKEMISEESTTTPSTISPLSPIKDIIMNKDCGGIDITQAVLGFSWQEGEDAYVGAIAQLKDSALLGNLLRSEDFALPLYPEAGNSMVLRVDTGSATITYNSEVVVWAMPLSHTDYTNTRNAVTKLLQQTEAQSIISNENFRQQQSQQFDIALWINSERFLNFSDYAGILYTQLYNTQYVSFLLQFREGEIAVQQQLYRTSGTTLPEPLNNLPIDGNNFLGMINYYMDLNSEQLKSSWGNLPPLDQLPLGDDEIAQLLPELTGRATLLWYDTASIYVNYERDDYFTGDKEMIRKKKIYLPTAATYEIKDAQKVKLLIDGWMQKDSAERVGTGWRTRDQIPMNIFIENSQLTVSDLSIGDYKLRPKPAALGNMSAYIDLGKTIKRSPWTILSYFIPNDQSVIENAGNLFGTYESSTNVEHENNKLVRDIRIKMKNGKTNALAQLLRFADTNKFRLFY